MRLALLGALLAVVFVVTGAGPAAPTCDEGTSSVGPAVLIDGHLDRQQSDLTPRSDACLGPRAGHAP